MCGEVGKQLVLRELDLNIVNSQNELNVGKSKGGTWRTRMSVEGKNSRKEQGEGPETDENRNCINGKRGFCLVDEEKQMDDPVHMGKKVKVGKELITFCENLVGVASHKWPQIDK